MTRTLWAVLLAGVLGGASSADDAITVKIRRPAQGEVAGERKEETATATVTATKAGQTGKKELPSSSTAVYADEVVEKKDADKKPTKLKRKYETWEMTRAGKKLDLGLSGKTVTISKGFEKYTFEADGQPVAGEAAALLNKEFNTPDEPDADELMLPKKPVKAGDTWELDGKQVAKAFADDLKVDADKVKASGKLVKVYDKDKAKYGVIEYTIDLPVTGVLQEGRTADALPGSQLTITLTVDACIDGSVYGGTSTLKVDGTVKWKAADTDYSVTTASTLKTTAEPGKK